MYIYIYIYIEKHVYIFIYIYIYVYTCIHMYIHCACTQSPAHLYVDKGRTDPIDNRHNTLRRKTCQHQGDPR